MNGPWDIFCKVVDNYGDIGVAWRLSRQLAAEHGIAVRLWVDDLDALARLRPDADPATAVQHVENVEVHRWAEPFPAITPGDAVIETFQCSAPETLIQVMAGMHRKPAWINLDYLSAESWVGDCHARPSPHPRLPLIRHFFFPGFDASTGGLLRERGLSAARMRFLEDEIARQRFWNPLDAPAALPGELRMSLFCYERAPIADLLAAIADGPQRICCLVPEGQADGAIESLLGAGTRLARGALRVIRLPWLSQDDYDRLLWACDLNFVRGEDSFIRAQWAEQPFIWNAYPQEASTHWIKLNAFLDRYCEGLYPPAAEAVRDLSRGWNGMISAEALTSAWRRFVANRDAIGSHSAGWATRAASSGDLAGNLVRFCKGLI